MQVIVAQIVETINGVRIFFFQFIILPFFRTLSAPVRSNGIKRLSELYFPAHLIIFVFWSEKKKNFP